MKEDSDMGKGFELVSSTNDQKRQGITKLRALKAINDSLVISRYTEI